MLLTVCSRVSGGRRRVALGAMDRGQGEDAISIFDYRPGGRYFIYRPPGGCAGPFDSYSTVPIEQQ